MTLLLTFISESIERRQKYVPEYTHLRCGLLPRLEGLIGNVYGLLRLLFAHLGYCSDLFASGGVYASALASFATFATHSDTHLSPR